MATGRLQTICLALAVGLVLSDSSIVVLALPDILARYSLSIGQVAWVLTGFNVVPGHPNCVAPRKRPFHTIIPGFVTRNGEPVMTLGLMGGSMQPQGHTQLMVRMADYHQNPQAAIDAPRFRIVQGLEVNVEPGFAPAVLEELTRRGHRIVALPQIGRAHV